MFSSDQGIPDQHLLTPLPGSHHPSRQRPFLQKQKKMNAKVEPNWLERLKTIIARRGEVSKKSWRHQDLSWTNNLRK